MVEERTLTRRELNRALLERQLLLARSSLPVARAVGRLGGLQAQSTPSPYLSLWTRLDGFERDGLTRALQARRVVKALLQRGTLHVVVPRHYWAHTAVRRPPASALWPTAYEVRSSSAEIRHLAKELLRELERRELTLTEAQELLAPHARESVPPTFPWRRLQSYAPIVHVAPSGIWGYGGHGVYAAAAGRLRGEEPAFEDGLDVLVTTYLRAYGPASAQDFGRWAGIPRLGPIREALGRLSLRTFREERGSTPTARGSSATSRRAGS